MKTAIQANISGYDGKPATLFSVYDSESGILVISILSKEFKAERHNDCLMIGNDTRYPVDFIFDKESLIDSVESYNYLKKSLASDNKSTRLIFSDKANNSDPVNAVQRNGYGNQGNEQHSFDIITNAQAAALATCLWASKSSSIDIALDGCDYLINQLMNGGLITLGSSGKHWQEQRSFVHGFQADTRYISESQSKILSRLYGT